ncbi:MAG: T9SS type A sorting domain-containing protein [Bacteroidia bacterium]|nr:T9SS type A sorting domain-containing protein [Bacteroidia bacterium]
MKKTLLLLFILIAFNVYTKAQVAKEQVLRVEALALENDGITLTWPAISYAGVFDIYKRANQTILSWGSPIASVAGNQNSYTDNTVKKGEAFEYQIVKRQGSTVDALGYIYAGNALAEPKSFSGIILLIDSNYITPLQSEIDVLKQDLISESYNVYTMYAGRKESPIEVKKRIASLYQSTTKKPECLFIIGHAPVPYSGFYSSEGPTPPPDGHIEGSGNHTGAWPADAYYAVLDGEFTDEFVTCTTGAQARHHNIPGDGKFDQSKLSAEATLEVGRVDFFSMPAFNSNDTMLTKKYLQRNHAWRTAQWKVTERALIDNNFTGFNLASTGYANFAALMGSDSTFDNRDYMSSQKNGGYLWSYGCGAGSYTSCNGIGNTNSFVNDSFENVFTILAGSFFGDWDIQNNFLKAPIASKSLASFWGGIPKWYVHHMAMGERIGKGVKITQNNNGFYFTGNFNSSANSMHIALMGDPTLKMRNLEPMQNLSATSDAKKVFLHWPRVNATSEYAVYVVDSVNNTYSKLHDGTLTDTFFVDNNNHYSGQYLYAVKAIQLEKTASGTFYNTGAAAFARVNHVNSISKESENTFSCKVFPNPLSGQESLSIAFNLNQSSPIKVQIYDMQGRQIWFSQYEDKKVGTNEIVIEKMPVPAGIYFLQVQAASSQFVQKLVVAN